MCEGQEQAEGRYGGATTSLGQRGPLFSLMRRQHNVIGFGVFNFN